MAHKQFTKDDIVWIEKYFIAGIKTPRIVEIMGKKQPVYDVINFWKLEGMHESFGKNGRKTNLDALENLLSFLLKMKHILKIGFATTVH